MPKNEFYQYNKYLINKGVVTFQRLVLYIKIRFKLSNPLNPCTIQGMNIMSVMTPLENPEKHLL